MKIFPLIQNGKTPLGGTRGFKDAIDQDQADWLNKGIYNIGIPTGATNGLVVLDIDVKDGKRGPAHLAELQKAHGALPETRVIQTPTNGLHYYFAYPALPAGK